jgi:hypothetical protein
MSCTCFLASTEQFDIFNTKQGTPRDIRLASCNLRNQQTITFPTHRTHPIPCFPPFSISKITKIETKFHNPKGENLEEMMRNHIS